MTITTPGLAEVAAKKIGGIITATSGSLSVRYTMWAPPDPTEPSVFPIDAMSSTDTLVAIIIEEDRESIGKPKITNLTVGGVLAVTDSDTAATGWANYSDYYYNLTFVDGS